VTRRPGHLAVASRPNSHLTQATAADLLNHFEVWTVLECHAVAQAALAPHRDLRSLRAVFPDFSPNQQVLGPADSTRWHHLELRLHRAISEQSGNAVLAHMVARVCGDLQAAYLPRLSRPIHRPGTLWLLQCQHRQILSCIEAGDAEDAVLHTRAHLHLIRDQLLAAVSPTHVL
jgi:DNA-binding GntR family transcriptional regulator